ncbi:beta-ketoacyl synthase chain length factor [Tahibacter harae]|uniref:Beta-ketoacyl synthase chain length factor n=1 Tax=Tahibacter harae TaxID=2963937 RepID=A0ABT1QPQ4_9GAMM|nr:beta-ketoacyl synthase chain length factor [Tahibacter harae]MCQ4164266.1 beta-ketoacyl synthase chain length factor [Tahibacter harae]
MSAVALRVLGVGVYAPGLPDWPTAAAALRGGHQPDTTTLPRPSPPLLPAAERRRAPETVLYAAQAAAEACAQAGLDPAVLPCIFASAQGDIAINDYMCATLASAPLELSPTKFHNSVHNAAVGYWSIATGCRAASTAISAWTSNFGNGLLEAALQAADCAAPVLLSVYDTAAVGALQSVIPFDCGFAAALVLAPDAPDGRGARLRLQPAAAQAIAGEPEADWACALRRRNASADALLLLQALAGAQPACVDIAAGPDFLLAAEVRP